MNKNRREQYCGTKQCFYPAERAGGTRVLERCLASKERAAPHTLSVDTRATDMEKYKSWHVVGTTLTFCSLKWYFLYYVKLTASSKWT